MPLVITGVVVPLCVLAATAPLLIRHVLRHRAPDVALFGATSFTDSGKAEASRVPFGDHYSITLPAGYQFSAYAAGSVFLVASNAVSRVTIAARDQRGYPVDELGLLTTGLARKGAAAIVAPPHQGLGGWHRSEVTFTRDGQAFHVVMLLRDTSYERLAVTIAAPTRDLLQPLLHALEDSFIES